MNINKTAWPDPRSLCQLLHHITVDLPRESYYKLNPKAVPGVDEVIWSEYGKGLEERLAGLYDRVRNVRCRAKPSKRTYVPKKDGRQRPIGITAGMGGPLLKGFFALNVVCPGVKLINTAITIDIPGGPLVNVHISFPESRLPETISMVAGGKGAAFDPS